MQTGQNTQKQHNTILNPLRVILDPGKCTAGAIHNYLEFQKCENSVFSLAWL